MKKKVLLYQKQIKQLVHALACTIKLLYTYCTHRSLEGMQGRQEA